ncbi:MOSC N-terminal beta barrel domain-containing protein [Mixta calida]|uniref:YcbX family protein n=1 Tax=Mixta calida TaxID=665913 RepID=UPI002911AB14|nr:MOSC N-terminal beta barrel domain-containing protein [Mixta calida]MDU6536191.1 MOSC N-terminal beta barrel domain-containing protein [Mixta calida]
MIVLSRLFVHPVKSMRGLQVSHAQVAGSGLAFDRLFMLTTSDGTFITARQHPQLVQFIPALTPDGLWLQAPDGSSAALRFDDFQPQAAETEVWGNHFTARIAPQVINDWLSGFFPRPVQLRWVGPEMTRRVKRRPDVPLGFADGYPFLLVNEASLYNLQQRCAAGVRLEQFRPNLAVTGARAWEEDSWARVRVGEVEFEVAKPCSRCIFTTISPERGEKHPDGEPLKTLQSFRSAQDESGDVDFGLNLLACNSGVIRVGDTVEVLQTQTPRQYGAGKIVETMQVEAEAESRVSISYRGSRFSGNNQQVLLEQLEMQGYRIPYSCRAGLCGSCEMRLVSGKVKALKQDAVRDDGTVLSCSCIPAGDIELA